MNLSFSFVGIFSVLKKMYYFFNFMYVCMYVCIFLCENLCLRRPEEDAKFPVFPVVSCELTQDFHEFTLVSL